MIPGALLLVAGVALAIWGGRALDGDERPRDLLGALAAAGGVLLACIGGTSMLVPGFL